MRVETEKEFKFQMSKKDFYKLKKYIEDNGYERIEVINQTNYYIDTEDFELRNFGTTLRVRHFTDEDTFEMTAKIKKDTGEEDNELKVKEEVNIDLSKEDAEDILKNNNIKEHLCLFKEKAELFNGENIKEKLFILGSLSTERSNYRIDEDTFISFDKSNYFDVEDYEIELETRNIERDRLFLKGMFKNNNIKIYLENKSKIKRFIEKLNIKI